MDYTELQQSLSKSGIPLKIEECHAVACACLCIAPRREDYQQVSECLGQVEDWVIEHRLLAFVLETIAPDILGGIESEELAFDLLMPSEDSASLADRIEALANWCAAFLLGLSVSTPKHRLDKDALSEDSRDFIKDLSRIVDLGGDDGRRGDEGSESDLYQLRDYCRLGVIGVYLDLNRSNSSNESGPKPIN